MRTTIIVIFIFFISAHTTGQVQRKASTYLFAQYNSTLYDRTKNNNLSSFGLGVQTFFNNKTSFKLSLEFTSDFIYLDDKVLRTNINGLEIKTVTSMFNLFAGTAFYPTKNFYLSFLAGPSLINGRLLLGIKPSVGCYLTKNQNVSAKISYINIFNRDKMTGDDYGLTSFAIGLKLF